ncbi:hypothetical protein MNBD_PLANCTO03-1367 [hydrothermal vent metagenome]|uniref:HDOD domain-containing protein n=1 Tax=hydrothermal vent metagenome TaxID=652676 RepID=A0A3B1E770_9ZZZZ
MKVRSELTAAELAELYDDLDRRLSRMGIETQPSVALSILDLTQNPDAGMQDYAKIIRNDPGLTGRLLRLSNSAFFAQRQPVTNIDRACVLLGMARVRSISLGFYLSQAAASDAGGNLSREVWGQSVFRACLAAEIARAIVPSYAPEAFVIGLMLDAGVPLAQKMLGEPFEVLYAAGHTPTKSFHAEFSQHGFTHVDVITAMMRQWKFPDLLCKPISWHHTPPPPSYDKTNPVHLLYRVAYYAGAISLGADGTPTQRLPMASAAQSHLGFGTKALDEVVTKAADEYGAVLELFSDVADPVAVADLPSQVHSQLIGVLDAQMEGDLAEACAPGPQRFRLGGYSVMLRPDEDGWGVAFSYDTAGEPLSTYRFLFAEETAGSLRASLGLEAAEGDDLEAIGEYLEQLAA